MKIVKTLSAICLGLVATAQAYAACPAGTSSISAIAGKEACIMKGTITSDLTLTSDKVWILSGGVYIGGDNINSATLTIQPGTKIYGQTGPDFLVINRGSKIMAQGTKDAPIVFTTIKTLLGEPRTRGSWGGLVLLGNAPINGCAVGVAMCEAQAEGGAGTYGGSNPADNSGVLKYVIAEFSGYEVTPDNEINGITFYGVGSGTTVDYVQVHMNSDDGIELFGGTVNLKHVVLTGNADDSLDFDKGWRGKAQFGLVMQAADEGNNGIEADNNKSPMDAAPRTFPELSNFTLVGSASSANGEHGMLLRRGMGMKMHNSIVSNFKASCMDIDDKETFSNSDKAEGISFTNTIIDCPAGKEFMTDADDVFSVRDFFMGFEGSVVGSAKLDGYLPVAGSPALVNDDVTPLDAFFDEVDFIGAVKDRTSDWTKGWISTAQQ